MPIRSAIADTDLRPFVEEAIRHFGFVKPAALDWLAAEVKAAHTRNNGRTIREGGTRITPDERVALGLHRWDGGHLSREALDALTEFGRNDPIVHFDATCSRAVKRALCLAQIGRHAPTAHIMVGVKFCAGTPSCQPCGAAAPWHEQLLAEPPMLPLPDCDRLQCCCSWRGVSKFEAARRQL